MPDLLTVILPSLIAIGVMVVLIRALRLERPVVLDESQVRQSIAEHYEGAHIRRIALGRDGKGAVVYLDGDPALVLVRALGDRISVRPVSATVLKALTQKNDDLIFVLHDLTWPAMHLRLDDADARKAEAANLLAALEGKPGEEKAHA